MTQTDWIDIKFNQDFQSTIKEYKYPESLINWEDVQYIYERLDPCGRYAFLLATIKDRLWAFRYAEAVSSRKQRLGDNQT